jgi:hypothetical protein
VADPRDLVTKAQVEAWLNSNNPSFNVNADTINIPLAITDCSVDWYSYTGRRSLNRFVPCNDRFDGAGGDRQFLRDFPAALVSAVYCNGISVPQGSYGTSGTITSGWILDQKRESLSIIGLFGTGQYGLGTGPGGAYAATGGPLMRQRGGYGFGQPNDGGRQNVMIQYFAGGSLMFDETATPAANQITVSQAALFYMDLGVIYSLPQSGQLVALTAVASNPAVGQYSVSSTGVYTFNAGDAAQPMSITYAYNAAMPDIQMAVIMQVVEELYTRKTAGLVSQGSAEGGTTTYSKVARPKRVIEIMNKYKRGMVGM